VVSVLDNLPCLGVGASLSLEASPDPVALVRRAGGPSFIEYAGKANFDAVAREVARVREAGAPVLFHPSYINFCGTFPNDPAWLAETARHLKATGSPWFAQDLAYCSWGGHAGYSTQLGYFLPPFLNEASLELACARVREVMQSVSVPVAVEPPPFTFVVGTMALLPFFAALSERTDAAVLLDAGHLVSYELASSKNLFDDEADFPWHRVVEVHIAGGKLERNEEGAVLYVDAHEQPIVESTWTMFQALLQRASALKAVCFECEGTSEDVVLTTLRRVRELVVAHSSNPILVQRVREELRGAS
jgi:uncharacterized protein (UPF0276 family)